MSDYPYLFHEKKECCGCAACESICNQDAIRMEFDDEGFLYPVLDKSKCIKCFRCIRVCPFKNV